MNETAQIDILDLIPQRRPFVMVDSLLYFDMEVTTASLKILPDNIFAADGALTEAGVIESIAQTCAARMGYLSKYVPHDTAFIEDAIKIGFIGSIKNLTIGRRPRVNEEITVSITVLSELPALTLVDACVSSNGETLASGRMTISLSNITSHEEIPA
ncbi:MAG: pseudouridylate synthase [Bacteroidales bacterium]|jgi:predicted hotdog family 3-hydroxylacyl-ACP dehydratase|nr:pseudouridylate synthase [Bacteroidales bacterium]